MFIGLNILLILGNDDDPVANLTDTTGDDDGRGFEHIDPEDLMNSTAGHG